MPGKKGPHVAAVDVIKATTKTTRENAVQQWARLKHEHPETVSGSYSFRFPGQRGPETETVSGSYSFRFPGQRGPETETVSGSYSFRFPGQRGPARDQDALEEFQHNRFKRQLEQDVLSEKANSERQERADFCHEQMHLRQE